MTLEDLAKEFIALFEDAGLGGISDEMSSQQIDLSNRHYETLWVCQQIVANSGTQG